MTRKAPAKKTKKPAKPAKAYIVVREMVSVNRSYTEPDRVFVSKAAARKYAEQLNRELRGLVNPFADDTDVEWLMSRGEKGLVALVKKLRLPAPKKDNPHGYAYIDWEKWWDENYFNITDAQRDAIWDALDKYNWYTVKETTLE